MVIRAWALAASVGLASPALAEDCRLALVLALDVSPSVDGHEYRLQEEGVARALMAPEVERAFLTGDPVGLYIFEWSSPSHQEPLLSGWQMVRTAEDLADVADTLAAHPRHYEFSPYNSTALGAALSFAAGVLADGPDCRARTVDISGDGKNNSSFAPAYAFAHDPLEGVTVNALVIEGADNDADLVTWFEAQVLHGPGAFWVLADGYDDYERAMTTKLLRELELPLVSGSPLAGGGA